MNKRLLVALLVLSLCQGFSASIASAADPFDVVLNVDREATAEDVTYIREGIRLAEVYLEDAVDATMTGRVEINVRATNPPDSIELVAETTIGEITYYTESAGWYFSSPTYRMEVVIHEFVHIYQGQELEWNNWNFPAWILEGMAEYLSSESLIERGLLTRADAANMRYWLIAGVPLASLETYESFFSFGADGASVYGLAYLGIASLLDGEGVEQLGDFIELVGDGAEWGDAFADTFGLTPARFYRQFEEERRDFIEPIAPPPVYDIVIPVESASPVEITELMERVAPGAQFLMQAHSEPNARCIAYLWGQSLDLVHETTADAAANLFWLVTIPSETPAQTAEISVDCGSGPIIVQVEIRDRPHLGNPLR